MTWPRALLLFLTLLVIAGLWIVAEVAKLAGWQVCLGFLAGYFFLYCTFRWHYGWWPDFGLDGEDEANSRLPRIAPDRVNRGRLRLD
ncbi:hypothetical protein RHODGE_RHODGE_03329 [Rhodoplanes serenus]|uniref:Uncharacterized protein n=1 Tax=Rhodoplanes serenus TaxID=200615 RepID=A0A3S4FB59_9BRAD|nr:hypothetical protein [Rhodoplanes serenus]VCU10143.1 hypothetical protein RHODGE_RHODGE_03329 [Rhodoplanes serenus]